MNIHVMLVLLGLQVPKSKDLKLQEAPQVVCPLSLDEYVSVFRFWARKEVRERQLERGDLIKGKV